MRHARRTRTVTSAVTLTLSGALLLTGCGSSAIGGAAGGGAGNAGSAPDASQSVGAEAPDPALVAMVPAALRAKGSVTVATDSTYAPSEFKDADGHVVGMDIDLGDAIMKKLGLGATWQSADFSSILVGITAGKYDLSMSSFTDTRAREQQVDLVQYYNAGEAVATLTGNPDKLSGNAADLCGTRVSVQSNTTESDEIKNVIDPDCRKAGKPGIPDSGDQFNAQTDATSALVAKRDQAMMADSPVIDYAVKQGHGQLVKIGSDYNTAPYGIALPKGDGRLAQAVQGALRDLIADGSYGRILTRWGVESGALTADRVRIDAAAS